MENSPAPAEKRGRKASQAPRQQLVRPWGAQWEVWECDGPAGPSWVRVQTVARLADVPPGQHHLALPAQQVCAVAMRVPTAEEELGRESALLQLELLGLHPPGQDSRQLDLVLVEQRGEAAVFRAVVYPLDYETPPGCSGAGFLPSPLAVDWPARAVLLWPEGSTIVLCCTGENGVVAWENWHPASENDHPGSRLEQFLLELRWRGVLPETQHIHDWSGLLPGEKFHGLPIQRAQESPPPSTEISPSAWVPPGVLAVREQTLRRRKLIHIGLGAAIGLVTLLLLVLGYLTYEQWKINQLARRVAELEAMVGPSMLVARDWELLVNTIDPERFALEKLLLAVEALPPDGVRLSLFEARPDGLRIEGDARNVGLATLYFNSLQSTPGAENFEWVMPSPALQPDNSARFAIDAVYRPLPLP